MRLLVHLLVGLTQCLLVVAVTASSQGWTSRPSGTTKWLRDVKFAGGNFGLIVGESGTILQTTDGDLWEKHFPDPAFDSTMKLLSVAIIDHDTVVVVGQPSIILRSTDGGVTWANITNPTSGTGIALECVTFVDKDTGYVSGGRGEILKTSDAGLTWGISRDTTPINALDTSLHKIAFFTAIRGIAVGDNGTMLRTSNGGRSWLRSFPTSFDLHGLYVVDSANARVVGWEGTYLMTSDGGESWSVQTHGTNYYVSVFSTHSDVAYLVGQHGVISVANNPYWSETIWGEQTSGTLNELSAIYFIDPQVGTIVGENGTILQTVTGGDEVRPENALGMPIGFSLAQNYPNPFNPATVISYSISSVQHVKLAVYDIVGRLVTTLVDEIQYAGSKAVSFDGGRLPSGIYTYKLMAGKFTDTKKMLLIK